MKIIKISLAFICIFANVFSQHAQLPKLIPYYKDSKWGYSDNLKNIVIPCEYDEVRFFKNGYVVVGGGCEYIHYDGDDVGATKVCKSGVIDEKGNLIVPFQYESIEDFNEAGTAQVSRDGKMGYISQTGKEILPCIYTFKSFYNTDLIRIFLDGKVGLINNKGILVLPCQYDNIEQKTERYFITRNKDKFGLLHKTTEKEILPCKYDRIDIVTGNNDVRDTYFKLMIDDKWGVADSIGNMILSLKYDNINLYDDIFQVTEKNENFLVYKKGEKIVAQNYEQVERLSKINILKLNLLKVYKNGKWGVVDSVGNEIIPCQYDDLIHQRNINAIIAVKDGKYGLLDIQGEEIVSCVYEPIKEYYSDYYQPRPTLVVSQKGKYGLINSELRKEVVSCKYNHIAMFESYTNLYVVDIDSNSRVKGLIDNNGKVILPCEYQHIFSSKPDVVMVNKNDSIGFLNVVNGRWLIPLQYQSAMTRHTNPFILKLNDKWGLVDSITQKPLTAFKFDNIESNDFTEKDFAQVKIGSQYGIINRKGEEIVPCIYDKVESVYSLFFVKRGQKWGVINQAGKQLKTCIYTDFETSLYNKNKWINVKDKDKWGVMSGEGKIIISPQYQSIASSYNYSKICVSQADKWGVVDSVGNEIIPCRYDVVRPVNKNYIAVQIDGLWGIVDSQNNQIVPCQYGSMEISGINLNDIYSRTDNSDVIKIRKNGRWGMLSKDGKQELIPCRYDAITVLSESLYVAHDDYVDEFYNSKGTRITWLEGNERRNDYRHLLRTTGYSLIKTKFGYIDFNGNTYFK